MAEFIINIEKDSVINNLQGKASELQSKMLEMIDDISGSLEAVMIDEAPYNNGMLRRSITTESIGVFGRWVGTELEYAPFVVFGTRPHKIMASGWISGTYMGVKSYGRVSSGPVTVMGATMSTGKSALWWPGAPHPVRSVMHPGTDPNDFVQRAYDRSESLVEGPINDFMSWIEE